MPLSPEKSRVRHAALAKLKAMLPAQRAAKSAALRCQLAPLLGGEASLRIGLYAPLPHEVDLLPLLHEYPQHRYAFPRCLPGHRLCFHEVSDPATDLIPGAHGILAPQEDLPVIGAAAIDLLLVPGVAFTREGVRLGYGGGYYDRFILLCIHARILSLAFEEQIFNTLPMESHDLCIPYLYIA